MAIFAATKRARLGVTANVGSSTSVAGVVVLDFGRVGGDAYARGVAVDAVVLGDGELYCLERS